MNLGNFKVGWMRASDQTVLALGNRVVTHNSRYAVTHDDSTAVWTLKIKSVRESDRGCYMCQINTTPMQKQLGCVDIYCEYLSISSRISLFHRLSTLTTSIEMHCVSKYLVILLLFISYSMFIVTFIIYYHFVQTFKNDSIVTQYRQTFRTRNHRVI